MKILLTGGTGFLGTAFLRFLASLPNRFDFDVTVVSSGRTGSMFVFTDHVEYLQLDLTDMSSVDAFENLKFDTVLHFATTSTLGSKLSEIQRFRDITLIDCIVLEIVKKVKANHLVWASSGAVYGKIDDYQQTNESKNIKLHNLFDESAYRIGKIKSEYHAAKFAELNNIKLDILRLFSFAGIDLPLDVHFALGNFIRDALKSECINIAGTGLAKRSYLDQNDFAEIIHCILRNPSSGLRVLNIGSPEEMNLECVANIVRDITFEVLGSKPDLKIHNEFDDRDNYYVPDIGSLQAIFPDLRFKSLLESVRAIVKYSQR